MWLDEIDEIFEQMFRALKSGKIREPLYYGFSVSIGPSGVPEVKTFGNVQPGETGELLAGAREPFTDVIVNDKGGEVVIIAEMPGVAKEDIKINAAKDSIEIKAETKDRKYYKNLPLAAEIDPNSTNAKYNNGILEVKARLKKPELKIPIGSWRGMPSSLRKGVDIKID